ncbi:hypothetical protein [Xylophilus sp.]|uniref:hypothetical protein n=1 Tax=Xylophilus sp. TaxID=2653893 RepID=UPI0013BE1B36|nr:hypothetical protein [Xylophilus sp.]KAF1045611.1 MAG: hypothetical protein GAK38_02903 [Xylophilus sp.]
MSDQKFIYETHPVSPERKAQLRAQGYRIRDAAFAPSDYVHPDAPKGGKEAELNATQLKEELTKRNIEFAGNASKVVLKELYDQAIADEAAGGTGA